jgi:hypothetical protein
MNAGLFGQSHSNLVLGFRLSKRLHFAGVHHFHQFAFLHLSKGFAIDVSIDAGPSRKSHSNLVRHLPLSTHLHFDTVHYSKRRRREDQCQVKERGFQGSILWNRSRGFFSIGTAPASADGGCPKSWRGRHFPGLLFEQLHIQLALG